MTKKRIINVKVLPGQPIDGSGKICIHLFVPDKTGPFVEQYVLSMEENLFPETGQPVGKHIVAKPTRGRLACDPKRLVVPVEHKGVTTITIRTDDPRAATCLGCIGSKFYIEKMKIITDAEAAR